MAEIVAGLAMSHVALVADAPDSEQIANIRGGWSECARQVEAVQPLDAVVAFVDDHFENFSRRFMPAIGVATAGAHIGPPHAYLDWLGMDRREVPGHASLAETLLTALTRDGFDPTRLASVELGHNYMEPLRHLAALEGVPMVPVFLNAFTQPTPPPERAYRLGSVVARALAGVDDVGRVLVIGTGGLSHDPMYWHEGLVTDDPFYQRMYRFQQQGLAYLEEDPDLFSDLGRREDELGRSGKGLINADWDQRFLQALADGDVDYVRRLVPDEMVRDAGLGANEALNWVAVMGAMGGRPAKYTLYEPVQAWITGFGFAIYDGA